MAAILAAAVVVSPWMWWRTKDKDKSAALSEYERYRLDNIARNEAFLRELGRDHEAIWNAYLAALAAKGLSRDA